MLSSVLLTAGWLMLGRGFDALRPRPATPVGRALALLVVVAFVVSAALSRHRGTPQPHGARWRARLADPAVKRPDDRDRAGRGLRLWVIVRGLGDELRPVRATRLGAAAATIWAVATVLGSLVVVAFLVTQPLPNESGTSPLADLSGWVAWMTVVVAPAMFVAAIAIGLVDPDAPAS